MFAWRHRETKDLRGGSLGEMDTNDPLELFYVYLSYLWKALTLFTQEESYLGGQ